MPRIFAHINDAEKRTGEKIVSFTPRGIVVSIVTPLAEEGELNEKACLKLID